MVRVVGTVFGCGWRTRYCEEWVEGEPAAQSARAGESKRRAGRRHTTNTIETSRRARRRRRRRRRCRGGAQDPANPKTPAPAPAPPRLTQQRLVPDHVVGQVELERRRQARVAQRAHALEEVVRQVAPAALAGLLVVAQVVAGEVAGRQGGGGGARPEGEARPESGVKGLKQKGVKRLVFRGCSQPQPEPARARVLTKKVEPQRRRAAAARAAQQRAAAISRARTDRRQGPRPHADERTPSWRASNTPTNPCNPRSHRNPSGGGCGRNCSAARRANNKKLGRLTR